MSDTFESIITELIANREILYSDKWKIGQIVNVAKKLNEFYVSGEPMVSDEIYDFIVDYIKVRDPRNKFLESVGFLNSKQEKHKVNLPVTLGSMTKPTSSETEKFIGQFLKLNGTDDYVLSDKLDGVSALIVTGTNGPKMYTRGNGTIGVDISNLIQHINIFTNVKKRSVLTRETMMIRGELIISKRNFEQFESVKANARNMVSGIVNSKRLNTTEASTVDFVAYELVSPWMSFENQMKTLSNLGFNVVFCAKVKSTDIVLQKLREIFVHRKEHSPYCCDGIIVSKNNVRERSQDFYPNYSFAFKLMELQEQKDVIVTDVEWQISKDGYIKPVLKFKPFHLGGVTIQSTTGFNAKFIVSNCIGPGSKVTMIRSGDVIPFVIGAKTRSKSGKPKMPENIQWTWNSTNVDIITVHETNEQKVSKLVFFCTILDIKDIGRRRLEQFVESGIDTVEKLMTVSVQQLLQIDGFKEKMARKAHDHIREQLSKMELTQFMAATGVFGHGYGVKRLRKLFECHPDILLKSLELPEDELIALISQCHSFNNITATQFAENIHDFFPYLQYLPKEIYNKLTLISTSTSKSTSTKLAKKFVFTGFRDKSWEKLILDAGGEVNTSVSNKTNFVVASDKSINDNSSSVFKANKLGIPVLTREDFEKLL